MPLRRVAARGRQEVRTAAGGALNEILEYQPGDATKFVFVGGKGGVGKTSTSAALAVACADAGLRTLVVSTDPAHSLGDALEVSLSEVQGKAVALEDCDGLDAMEVDAEAALGELAAVLQGLDLVGAAREVGGDRAADAVAGLGLGELAALLERPPPGVDELVALAQVVSLAESGGYDRVLLDTAPTGHTLRLLAAPDFLEAFLAKLTALRGRLDGILGMGAGLLGLDVGALSAKLDRAVEKLEAYRVSVAALQLLFRDGARTHFVCVASPTPLAVAETRRLVDALQGQGISVRHVVVNKVLQGGGGGEGGAASDDAVLATMRRGQAAALARAVNPASPLGKVPGLTLTKVPLFDADISGLFGLRYMADVAFCQGDTAPAWASLLGTASSPPPPSPPPSSPPPPPQRFVIVGGKGGVGKTSTAAALAVACAEGAGGLRTAVVSTDPAHSLGDALGLGPLPPGELVEVEVLGGGGGGTGTLVALEVDPSGALGDFQDTVRAFTAPKAEDGGGGGGGGGLLGGLELGDLADVLDTAPPGLDELVALSRVLQLVQAQEDDGAGGSRPVYDRVVIDTAPTGHTLRLLAFPAFIDDFLERVIALRRKLSGASSMINMLSGKGGGGGGGGAGDEAAEAEARDRLREFQVRMYALEDLLTDASLCEFVVVTVPTELGMAESERLVVALTEEGIAVQHLVVNQVLPEPPSAGEAAAEAGSSYADRLRSGQGACTAELRAIAAAASPTAAAAAAVAVTEVPWLDVEARGVYGLRALAMYLLR